MAITITVNSGSVANNNLNISVATTAPGNVQLSIGSGGNLIFTDSVGTVSVTSYTVSNFAAGGIPNTITNSGVGTNYTTMSAATFGAAGLVGKMSGLVQSINAVDATQADIANLITYKANIAATSATQGVENVTLTAAQFASLTGVIKTAGALTVNAAGASQVQLAALIAGAAQIVDGSATTGVTNASLTYGQFAGALNGKIANGGAVSVDATDQVLTVANIASVKIASGAVINISSTLSNAVDLVNGAASKIATWGFEAVDCAVDAATNYSVLLANRTKFSQDSLFNVNATYNVATNMTAGQLVQLAGKIGAGEVANLNLANQTADTINSVIANAVVLASGTAINGLQNATLTPSQFVSLIDYIMDAEATVDATGASLVQTQAMLDNAGLFAANGLSNLTLTAGQFAGVTGVNVGILEAALDGTLTVNADAGGSVINALSWADSMTLAGSNSADTFFAGIGNTTMRGAQGNDSLVGNAGDDVITGGAGNDTMTGGGGADTFNANAGSDTVTDLVTTDSLVVSAGAAATANNVTAFVATNASSNAGTATINTSAAGATVDMALAVGSVGYNLNGNVGIDLLTGSSFADVIAGGAGNDVLIGGAGADTLRGGSGNDSLQGDAGNDLYQVNAGTDTVVGLATGDVLVVSSGATLAANADIAAFVATAATSNAGTAALSTNTAVNAVINMAAATGTAGFSLTGNNGNDSLTGSVLADTIVGGAGNNVLRGNAGNDSIQGGAVADTIYGGAGNDTMTGGAGVDTFYANAGTDTITDLGVGGTADVLQVSGGVTVNATATGAWTATGVSVNEGTLNIAVGNGVAVNASGMVTYSGVNFTSGIISTVTGTAFADTMTGGAGVDTFTGLGGRDIIALGADAAADTVKYTTAATSVGLNGINSDVISNFTSGSDVINLQGGGGAGALLAGVTIVAGTTTAAAFAAQVVDATSVASISDVYTAIAANTAFSQAGNFAASTGAASGIVGKTISFANGAAAGTYLVVNDGNAAFQGATDFVVKVGAAATTVVAGDLTFAA